MFGIVRFIINIVATIIELSLVFRLVLKFVQANPGTPFVAWIYGMTELLVAPFSRILPNWKISNFVIDFSTLTALIVYAIVAALILRILPGRHREIDV
ncbi:MAG: YggT family protein [Syntrophorhabdaceae bacterium]